MVPNSQFSSQVVRAQLARILASELFHRSDRLCRFLQFSVEAALNSNSDRVKEYVIGIEVFDRGPSFDPRIDPVVRVEARRLRNRLKRWHESEGRDSPIVIELPTGTYAAKFRHRSAAHATPQETFPVPKTIAVMPFSNLNGDADLDYFSDGLTEELIHALTRVQGLHVVAWPSVSRMKGQEQDIPAIRERLSVATVLRGSVRRSGDRLRMTAQLIDTIDGHYLWSEAWDRSPADLLAIEQEIAEAIVQKLRLGSAPQRQNTALSESGNPESHMLYLKGRFHWNKRTPEGLKLAVNYFSRVTENDPDWPLGWAGLADAYAVIAHYSMAPPAESMLSAKNAAEKAMSLDPVCAEATTSLAIVRSCYDWEWEQAEELYKRAIACNPGYANAHHWYAIDFLTVLGRFEEAVAEIETAIRLDPLSGILWDGRAMIDMVSGRLDEAQWRYEALIEHDPAFYKSWSGLGRLLTQQGQYHRAIEMFEKARAMTGDLPKILGALGQTFGLAGETQKAREILDRLHQLAQTRFVGFATFSLIHLGLGERDKALRCLELATDQHDQTLPWLKIHPAWDPLRSETRFQAILRRVRLA